MTRKITVKSKITVKNTIKRVNRGTGLGLEILVEYFFHGSNEVIRYFKKSIEKTDQYTNVKAEKCRK